MIKIVDYGMGNLRSVQKAFEKIGAEAVIVTRPADVEGAQKLVLPGVGAFRDGIHELKRAELDRPVRDHIAAGKPFLGICLGLQLLFDVSYEDGQWEGLLDLEDVGQILMVEARRVSGLLDVEAIVED